MATSPSVSRQARTRSSTYLTGIRDSVYPWMKTVPVPISDEIFAKYGVSTTPTLVLIDRAGNVSKYNPGQLTTEQLEPLIQKIVAPAAAIPPALSLNHKSADVGAH